jgi:hypothetical protein
MHAKFLKNSVFSRRTDFCFKKHLLGIAIVVYSIYAYETVFITCKKQNISSRSKVAGQ